MICFQVSSVPSLGDVFTYNGGEYQIINNPQSCGMRGLLKAIGRYSTSTISWEKDFYFEINGK